MKKLILGTILASSIAAGAFAADVPQKYVQPLGDIGLVSVAGQMCPGFKVNQDAVVTQFDGIVTTAKADGMTEEQVQEMMNKVQADPSIIAGAMEAFAKKYNIKPDDNKGFCDSMTKEKASNKAVAAMLN